MTTTQSDPSTPCVGVACPILRKKLVGVASCNGAGPVVLLFQPKWSVQQSCTVTLEGGGKSSLSEVHL